MEKNLVNVTVEGVTDLGKSYIAKRIAELFNRRNFEVSSKYLETQEPIVKIDKENSEYYLSSNVKIEVIEKEVEKEKPKPELINEHNNQ